MTMTEVDEAERLARVAELQRRRAANPRPPRAAGPSVSPSTQTMQEGAVAPDMIPLEVASTPVRSRRTDIGNASKVGAAGFGFMVMFGLIAAMGYVNRDPGSDIQSVPTTPSPVVVVLRSADGSIISTDASQATPVTGASNQPVVLEAQPTVRQAPASQSPAGQTNGSR